MIRGGRADGGDGGQGCCQGEEAKHIRPEANNGDIVTNLSFASLFLLQWFGLAPVTPDTRAVTCSPAACAPQS